MKLAKKAAHFQALVKHSSNTHQACWSV